MWSAGIFFSGALSNEDILFFGRKTPSLSSLLLVHAQWERHRREKRVLRSRKQRERERKRCLQGRMGCRETQGWKPYQKPYESSLTSPNQVSLCVFFFRSLYASTHHIYTSLCLYFVGSYLCIFLWGLLLNRLHA